MISEDEHRVVEVLLTPIDGTEDLRVRLLRAWGSVGILGLLVARAIVNTKRYRT
jgi:hypothetical protein